MFKNMTIFNFFFRKNKNSLEEKSKIFAEKYKKLCDRYNLVIIPIIKVIKGGKNSPVSEKELKVIDDFLKKKNVAIVPEITLVEKNTNQDNKKNDNN